VAHDGEPEAEPALPPRAGSGALAEALEDVGQEGGVDPGAGVAHGQREEVVLPPQLHGHAATSPITEEQTNYFTSVGLAYRF